MIASTWHRFQDADIPDEGRFIAKPYDTRQVAEMARAAGA